VEWATLASAAAGAVIATASGAFFDRHRWRRERRVHLLEVRRTLYGEYLTCLSKARNAFGLLARDHELGSPERERAARERFASCYELRYQMTITASAPWLRHPRRPSGGFGTCGTSPRLVCSRAMRLTREAGAHTRGRSLGYACPCEPNLGQISSRLAGSGRRAHDARVLRRG
jgi:hypothetical protein